MDIYFYWSYLSHVSINQPEICPPLVVVFDNIDQVSPNLQRQLCLVLQKFFVNEFVCSTKLKIILMMRLSSAADKVASVPTSHQLIIMRRPMLSRILSFRCLNFLIDPDAYEEFSTMEDSEKIQSYFTIYQFFLNLVDVRGEMRVVLQGISGTNIRFATRHAIKWLSHAPRTKRNDRVVHRNMMHIEDTKKSVRKSVIPNTIIKLFHALCRGISSFVENSSLNGEFIVDHGVYDDIILDLSEVIVFVLSNSRLLRHKKHDVKGIRCRVGQALASEIDSQTSFGCSPS